VKRHFFLGSTGKSERFISPARGGGGSKVPEQNRQQHFESLYDQFLGIKSRQTELINEATNYELKAPIGIQIEFESFPGIELAFESLTNETQRIELLNVIHKENKTFATIFVPEGKLTTFENKLKAYVEERKDKNGKPRDNRALLDAVKSFRMAALEALWTDDFDQLPQNIEETIWWEVWLPVRGNKQSVLHDFKSIADGIGIVVSEKVLEFPERTVLLARGSRSQFSRSVLLLNNVSELRRAKETAAFFDELPIEEQHEWATDLVNRLSVAGNSNSVPHICILDTGVNIGHPLIKPFIEEDSQFSINPEWIATDDEGHGTGMAGLAVWGDITTSLETAIGIEVLHRLESVKVLRHANDNEDKHLGIITSEGVSIPEIQNPNRTRVFTMALSATDNRDRGRPSAWSAAVDSLAVDYLGDNTFSRLFVLCAGNSNDDLVGMKDYPSFNLLQDIHDPGQAWNALTVGAYTAKVNITDRDASDYKPLAPIGGLSPFSSTSVLWENSMPIKPEVVFEGGNVGVDAISCAAMPSLSLLTTHHKVTERLFSTFHATSAATAIGSRFAAQIYSHYPNIWPETVRALIVHSAEWTKKMCEQFACGTTDRQRAHHRIRCVGYGVPNLERALWSVSNSLSLIVEDQLQPFEKDNGKILTRDMHLHDLPWPKETLLELGHVDVEMIVTLSYFIEPNPSSRGVKGKYSYQSHGLRFDVKRPLESTDDFRKRVNRKAREEGEGTIQSPSDPNWLLGSQFRHKGSIHKDVWTGKAVELAERGQLAVYPAIGWWRTRTKLERYNKVARYSLIISIAVPGVDTDIYAEVLNKVSVEQPVEV